MLLLVMVVVITMVRSCSVEITTEPSISKQTLRILDRVFDSQGVFCISGSSFCYKKYVPQICQNYQASSTLEATLARQPSTHPQGPQCPKSNVEGP